jgi:putative protease
MRPELLSPAGSPEALRAAVESGADAVYLGWGSFNARQSAKNFSDEEFAQALRYCHERGVRVYLTLNTLVTDRELPQAAELARQASALGCDAVLIQDLGLLAAVRAAAPDLPLHASTQMSLFTTGGVAAAAALGCTRAVLARELSGEDAAAICRAAPAETELFAHGALCMCCSGQCAMSALIGGRSGNRGRCAQPCRLPYTVQPGGKAGYPLSLKDSCLAGALGEMAGMGAACVKLEGRMKRPEYVAVVTEIYARLLRESRGPTARELQDLDAAFSRQGFTDDYWRGTPGAQMFGVRPADAPEPKELFAAARAAYETGSRRTVPVRFSCAVRAGEAAALTVTDGRHAVTVTGAVPEAARSRAVTAEEISARLAKTGGSAYRCEAAETAVEPGLALSAAAVNDLRRRALTALGDARCAVPPRRELPLPPLDGESFAPAEPALTVSLTGAEQLSPALLAERPARISLPLESFAALPALPDFGGEWCAALPRVWRDRDEKQLRELLGRAGTLGVRGVLAGNLGCLSLVRESGLTLHGDYGLNLFNSRALAVLRELGFADGCVSFELRGAQIRDLRKVLPAEAVVYGRLPLMITENCLVRNARGCRCYGGDPRVEACSPRACARPCALTDRTGARFPLLPAWGHRTEIQNSRPLYLADRDDWRRLGLTFARLRFTDEPAEACARLLRAYRTGAPAPADFTRGLFDRGVE